MAQEDTPDTNQANNLANADQTQPATSSTPNTSEVSDTNLDATVPQVDMDGASSANASSSGEEAQDGLDVTIPQIDLAQGVAQDLVSANATQTGAFQTISATDVAGTSKKPKKSKRHPAKTALRIIFVLVIICAAIYGGGIFAFSRMAMPNTYVGDTDVSLKAFSEIAGVKKREVSNYQAVVENSDFTLNLDGTDLGFSFDASAYEQGLIDQQNALEWPLHILEEHHLVSDTGVTFDKDKLKEAITSAVETYNKKATKPSNASIAYSEETGTFAIVPEQEGSALDTDATYTYVEAQLTGLPSTVTLDDSCRQQVTLKSDSEQLTSALETANTYIKADVPLKLNNKDAGTLSKAQIAEWIVLGDDLSVSVDETKLAEWVKTNIAAKFDTAGSKRTYTRPDGKTVIVDAATKYWGNYYGWITDEASLVSLITEAVKSGSTEAINIPTKQTAAQVPDEGGRDWTNRYIDCDLTEQHVRLYDDSGNVIWESDCVTGKTAENHDTPAGVYKLNDYKQSGDVELRGQIDKTTGEPEYISHVKYWMPFINNSYAFHDASWRSTFGGTIYVNNGSHGCVNLPSDKAAELYDLCKVGDVVVVHY